METARDFARRVLERSGLEASEAPDGAPEVMLEGSVVASSPHGKLVLVDPVGEDADGVPVYSRAVLVERGPGLPPARPGATGRMGR